MATTTALQAIPVPQSSDTPNGPTQMTSIATALEQRVVMVFASAAARTSAFAAAGVSPASGMISYRQDAAIPSNGVEYYNGSAGAWRAFGGYVDRTELGSAAASMTISGIPTYLRHLSLHLSGRGDTAATSTQVNLRIAGDSTAVYRAAIRFMQNQSTTPTAANAGANVNVAQTTALVGYIPAATAGAGYGVVDLEISGWNALHANFLVGTTHGGYLDTAANSITFDGHWVYSGSSSYTSVTVLPVAGNFIAGSQLTLFGTE